MLKIRLQRGGKTHSPFYRVVLIEKKNGPRGKYLEKLGTYNPVVQPKEIILNMERISHWISKGAQPSETVTGLMKKFTELNKVVTEKKEKKKTPAKKVAPKAAPKKKAATAKASAKKS